MPARLRPMGCGSSVAFHGCDEPPARARPLHIYPSSSAHAGDPFRVASTGLQAAFGFGPGSEDSRTLMGAIQPRTHVFAALVAAIHR